MRRYLRRLYFLPVDLLDRILGRREDLCPPKGMIFIGRGDFIETGKALLDMLKEYGGLQPGDRVLDVGSGIGRLAVPLTSFLQNKGSYEGFDVVKSGVAWCTKNISSEYPNFNFLHVNLKNDLYNLNANSIRASNFVFPYKDEDFNMVFLFSVFSHMMPQDLENYLDQIKRVLTNGGICLATFFIINPENLLSMATGNKLNFQNNYGNYYLFNNSVKEANVAFTEEYLNSLFEKNNIGVKNIYYGSWSNRKNTDYQGYQDLVVLEKK